jgi:hypothetical protein
MENNYFTSQTPQESSEVEIIANELDSDKRREGIREVFKNQSNKYQKLIEIAKQNHPQV